MLVGTELNYAVINFGLFKIARDYENNRPGFVNALPKLTEEHVTPSRCPKMQVKLAMQLFSHTVAAYFDSHGGEKPH